MKHENTFDEEKEYRSTDEQFGPCFTKYDGDGVDAISAIAFDILEIFYRKDERVGEEEKENKRLRKSFERIRCYEKKSGEKDKEAGAGGRKSRDERETFESEWWDGINPGDSLITDEQEENFEGNDASENDRGEKKGNSDSKIHFWIDSTCRERAMWIREYVDFLIREIICNDGSDPCGDDGSDEDENRESIEKRRIKWEMDEEKGGYDAEERESSVIDDLREADIVKECQE